MAHLSGAPPFPLANTRNLDREPIGLMDTVATVTPALIAPILSTLVSTK